MLGSKISPPDPHWCARIPTHTLRPGWCVHSHVKAAPWLVRAFPHICCTLASVRILVYTLRPGWRAHSASTRVILATVWAGPQMGKQDSRAPGERRIKTPVLEMDTLLCIEGVQMNSPFCTQVSGFPQ